MNIYNTTQYTAFKLNNRKGIAGVYFRGTKIFASKDLISLLPEGHIEDSNPDYRCIRNPSPKYIGEFLANIVASQ